MAAGTGPISTAIITVPNVSRYSGSFSAADYRDASGIGRNLTIQVLEYLDRAGVTRFLREQRFLAGG